ncbi:hypothetical protein [Anaerovorax odorimutans]|uniref:hypothetical protein n=1 Tax=Anaerovorax odorimutans TaxID=109327 RepID=UPI0004155599|nr:hypothetical protein [Anaerovorax odorimutans]
MNDGRYYTFYQFFSIIVLVFLCIFVVCSMVISYYRYKEKNDKEYILSIFLCILIVDIFRVIECVIPNIAIANLLRYIQLTLFIILIWILYYYLFIELLSIFKLSYKYFNLIIESVFISLLIFGIVTNGKFLILSYDFSSAKYSIVYLICVCTFLFMVILAMIIMLLRKKQVHNVYKNSILLFVISSILVIPLMFYIYAIILKHTYLDFVEFFIYYMLCTILNISIYSEAELGLTTLAFDKIGDMIRDYIFVINNNGNIVYKNKSAANSGFLTKEETVSINNITDLYKGNIKSKKSHLGKDYIQLTAGSNTFYFTHKSKPLMDKEELIGYIITISDITPLMDLVFSLEDKKEKSKEANKKLENYSKVVYNLEKEKQINVLLDEIITSRENDMENLIFMINDLEGEIDNENFENLVDEAIEYNRSILDDVRQAVNTYRQHYGG